jgi:hypothetical protein
VYLCRGLVLGDLPLWHALGSAAYLVALIAIGYRLAAASFKKRLIV